MNSADSIAIGRRPPDSGRQNLEGTLAEGADFEHRDCGLASGNSPFSGDRTDVYGVIGTTEGRGSIRTGPQQARETHSVGRRFGSGVRISMACCLALLC
jgi:hypothetical protein